MVGAENGIVPEDLSADATTGLKDVLRLDEGELRKHLGEVVRGTVEETLNAMLDAEADAICGAARYERTPERRDTRSGHYGRKLDTRAGRGGDAAVHVLPARALAASRDKQPELRDARRRAEGAKATTPRA